MVSIYNSNGKLKPNNQYKAEVWAHDLTTDRMMFFLISTVAPKISKDERKALLKEFKSRKGMSFSEWKKG